MSSVSFDEQTTPPATWRISTATSQVNYDNLITVQLVSFIVLLLYQRCMNGRLDAVARRPTVSATGPCDKMRGTSKPHAHNILQNLRTVL